MDTPKIHLSAEEMQLLMNPEWILTKHRIIEKVYQLFGNISGQMQQYIAEEAGSLPDVLCTSSPKISKGEQYEALPYVVLDYPRIFSKENVLAVRTFFWWGNYFSITLHLKGKFYQQWNEKIAFAVANKTLQEFYFSFSGDEFSFNLEAADYFFSGADVHETCNGNGHKPFLKISRKIPFENWDTAEQRLLTMFQQFIDLLKN